MVSLLLSAVLVLSAMVVDVAEGRNHLRRNERKLGGVTEATLGALASSTGATFGGGNITSFTVSPFGVSAPVQYRVTFENLWTLTNHPPDFPNNAHWSPPVGASHGCSYTMWEAGKLASAGVVRVAEIGATSTIRSELQQEQSEGNVLDIFTGVGQFGLETNPSQTFLVDVDKDHPLISFVSMIAPSPDWFAGVHDLEPVRNGNWWESFTVELQPYDAGSDGGDTYAASNDPLSPRDPIRRIDATSNPSTMVFAKDGDVLPVIRLSIDIVAP